MSHYWRPILFVLVFLLTLASGAHAGGLYLYVGRCQKHITHGWPITASHLSQTGAKHATGEPTGEASHLHKTSGTACRHWLFTDHQLSPDFDCSPGSPV